MVLRDSTNRPKSVLTPIGPMKIKDLLKRSNLLNISGDRPLFMINATTLKPKMSGFPEVFNHDIETIDPGEIIKIGWYICRKILMKMKNS